MVGTIPGQLTLFGFTGDQTVSGSGVFMDQQGHILTNNHVVEGAKEVQIILSDGCQHKAGLVGSDLFADIAVLKSEGEAPAVALLGNSDVLNPGEMVIAICSPLGDFKNTVTVGVVSATGRSIETESGYRMEGLIQIDVAINQGNSGGPLVNPAGEVIGFNTLVVCSSSGAIVEGLGFAIRINVENTVAGQIIQKGYNSRPYQGVRWEEINPRVADYYDLPVQWGANMSEGSTTAPPARRIFSMAGPNILPTREVVKVRYDSITYTKG